MAQQTQLTAQPRTGKGKGFARKLRQEGKIPAILYGSDDNSILLSVNIVDLKQMLKGSSHTLININIDGDKKKTRLVMLKEIQGHPISRAIHHVDFFEVSEKQNVEVALPIHLAGEPIGVKRDKGILEHILRKLNVECHADAIPEYIEVDINELAIGCAIHVKELVLGDKIKPKDDPNQTVVAVVAPKVEEEKVAEVEEGVEGVGEVSTEEAAAESETEGK